MTCALILSGGSGSRLGSEIPKQYLKVSGRTVFSYCFERLAYHEGIDRIQVVAAPQWQGKISEIIGDYDTFGKFCGFSTPGENRQLSIFNGLVDIKKYMNASDIILIHDAARPMLSAHQVSECLNGLKNHDGALPALPMKDTLYQSADGGKVDALLNRSEIYAGQAPEAFRFGLYYEANKRLFPDALRKINGSTEPAIMAEMDIVMIPGDEGNFKITTKSDLRRFRNIVENGEL